MITTGSLLISRCRQETHCPPGLAGSAGTLILANKPQPALTSHKRTRRAPRLTLALPLFIQVGDIAQIQQESGDPGFINAVRIWEVWAWIRVLAFPVLADKAWNPGLW